MERYLLEFSNNGQPDIGLVQNKAKEIIEKMKYVGGPLNSEPSHEEAHTGGHLHLWTIHLSGDNSNLDVEVAYETTFADDTQILSWMARYVVDGETVEKHYSCDDEVWVSVEFLLHWLENAVHQL